MCISPGHPLAVPADPDSPSKSVCGWAGQRSENEFAGAAQQGRRPPRQDPAEKRRGHARAGASPRLTGALAGNDHVANGKVRPASIPKAPRIQGAGGGSLAGRLARRGYPAGLHPQGARRGAGPRRPSARLGTPTV